MLKIRLRRMGAIRQPHYRIVVADSRSPRDGRFIESLGHYNPLTDPATIQVDVAKYEEWKKKGAQPTDAVASLIKQFNRQARATEAAGEAQPTSRQTRTASGKGIARPAAAETAEAPTSEAAAEATRDEGEGAEAMTAAPAEAAAPEADTAQAEAGEAAPETEAAGEETPSES
jgi:small subunit ribosomal protein S16